MAGPPMSTRESADLRGASAADRVARPDEVTVSAPGRLHLGFLDPSATVGRRFGSIGMMIEDAETVLHLASADTASLSAAPGARHELERAERVIVRLQRASGRQEPLQIHISRALPAHVGLGSGTQLALALGRAFSELHGLNWNTAAIARYLGRGARSGIGLAGFDEGGVLVDGGHRDGVQEGLDVPPLLARFDFPEPWRVILVQDPARSGLHGETERLGLAQLREFGREEAAHLCHLVLMLILPALVERDFASFAHGLSELQRRVGDYFAPVQGGPYSSPAVGRLMSWISDHHPAGAGQSSWGPTAFAILPSEEQAQLVLSSARAAGMVLEGLEVKIVAGRNHGAVVERRSKRGPVAG
jgi:beta-ribofuranosylaminobenzene 5'-phosphate synthase